MNIYELHRRKVEIEWQKKMEKIKELIDSHFKNIWSSRDVNEEIEKIYSSIEGKLRDIVSSNERLC